MGRLLPSLLQALFPFRHNALDSWFPLGRAVRMPRRSGLHPDRTPGRHRDYRDPDRPALARCAKGPRRRGTHPVRQQPASRSAWRSTTTTTRLAPSRATASAIPAAESTPIVTLSPHRRPGRVRVKSGGPRTTTGPRPPPRPTLREASIRTILTATAATPPGFFGRMSRATARFSNAPKAATR